MFGNAAAKMPKFISSTQSVYKGVAFPRQYFDLDATGPDHASELLNPSLSYGAYNAGSNENHASSGQYGQTCVYFLA